MDYVQGEIVGHHASGVFLVQAEEMEGAVVYTILLIKDGVWDTINDIVGNKRRLEAGLQYENNFLGDGARGTRIPRLTIHMVTFLEGGANCRGGV
jgi:hypothetical protein